jgi:hypothetical protein
MYLTDTAANYLYDKFYPFTIWHVLSVILVTAITYYVTEYFIGFKLVRWIYIGTIIVIGASVYKRGDSKDAVRDVFKLATL